MIPEQDLSSAPPSLSFRLALAEEARASLEAVRVAQEAARLSARRQTRRARLLFLGSMAGLALVVLGVSPRLARGRHPQPAAGGPVASPASQAAPLASPSATVAQPVTAPGVPRVAEPAQVNGTPEVSGTDEGCDTALVRTAPWRLSADGCARAFALHPNDAALALAVAHAEHAHARLGQAAQWARRALALDPNAAEAYVIVARAETAEGQHDEARAAYRHYLELAPRGWHHAEARAALRGERTASRER
ncbi:MAG TPA: hypothetical protein VN962_16425 [Polyangia bacterium]|nr:hypothetical protein [Polyangia bacterium]